MSIVEIPLTRGPLTKPWVCKLTVDGRVVSLGRYATVTEAAAVRNDYIKANGLSCFLVSDLDAAAAYDLPETAA